MSSSLIFPGKTANRNGSGAVHSCVCARKVGYPWGSMFRCEGSPPREHRMVPLFMLDCVTFPGPAADQTSDPKPLLLLFVRTAVSSVSPPPPKFRAHPDRRRKTRASVRCVGSRNVPGRLPRRSRLVRKTSVRRRRARLHSWVTTILACRASSCCTRSHFVHEFGIGADVPRIAHWVASPAPAHATRFAGAGPVAVGIRRLRRPRERADPGNAPPRRVASSSPDRAPARARPSGCGPVKLWRRSRLGPRRGYLLSLRRSRFHRRGDSERSRRDRDLTGLVFLGMLTRAARLPCP